MALQIPVPRTTSSCTSTSLQLDQACILSSKFDWTHHLSLFVEEIQNRFEVDKVYDLELAELKPEKVTLLEYDLISTTPLLLSPISSASGPLSSHGNGPMWDSPQTPQTPLQLKAPAILDPTTPPTPPDSLEGIAKIGVDMTGLLFATPSRMKKSDDQSIPEKHTHLPGIFPLGIRKFQPLLKSTTKTDGEPSSSLLSVKRILSGHVYSDASRSHSGPFYNGMDINADAHSLEFLKDSKMRSVGALQQVPRSDERNYDALGVSSPLNIAMYDCDGAEIESIYKAIERRSKTVTSRSGKVATGQGVTAIGTSVPVQPISELRFDFPGIATLANVRFNPVYDSTSGKSASTAFVFGANHLRQTDPKARMAAPSPAKSEASISLATKYVSRTVPRGFKKYDRLLDHIMPFELTTRLANNPNRCVAVLSRTTEQCSNERQICPNVVKTIVDAVRDCADKSDYIDLPHYIEHLIKSVMCRRHRTVALRTDIAEPRMEALCRLIETPFQYPKEVVKIFEDWLKAISSTTVPPSYLHVKLNELPPLRLPKFVPYHKKPSQSFRIVEALKAKVKESLSDKDREDGFIYVFWDQQTFGMVKIGRTNDLKRRLKEWNKACGTVHHYHRFLQDGEPLRIPHNQRIEKLVHIELMNYRRKRRCDACDKTHEEWFEISAEKARKVYQKWEDWIIQKPYAQNDAGDWVLRPEMLGSLSEVCRLVDFPVPVKAGRPRLSTATRRSKPRVSTSSRLRIVC